ncbi:hypothetical protein Tsedi_00664 [Tepidimonas sediminis]|uniref:DUF2442 domain-containing protein n=1 Tax=Tepidimonas sediminis TaxID=2588941 RepID=A0A554WS07_9BURK|nr:DUF2442 domain-containing protein [Tepidimonas sediminis]TSE26366.1 hypothetical protein Tsedi_00664 [Tepidimonas sediminis]
MSTLLDVVEVQVEPPWTLRLRFENGEQRRFDVEPLLARPPFDRLKEPGRFATAHVAWGTVAWAGEIDIAPETLYDRSVPIATAGDTQATAEQSATGAPAAA